MNIAASVVTDPLGGELAGGWEQAYWFDMPIRVRSKSNFRRFQGGRREWAEFTDFEEQVARLARRFRPPGWELGPSGPRSISKRPSVVAFVWARTTLDAANLPKSVLDAVEGVVFHNDASCRLVAAASTRAGVDQRGFVAFARLDGAASLPELTTSLTELSGCAAELIDEQRRSL